eukprot:TRINITY_DN37841_c0_g1_i1.p2 TRINITY_DN37841_c0_g1~~TRINITY_DN37841_c0_g1_i1.p2  ORF type:complete len:258 (-),score=56.63 TRINITY_DN37841_c0_g1_i1:254-961(-)
MDSELPPVKCANGHVMEPEAHTDHSCDFCRASPTLFCCRQCGYDMCLKCARNVELPLTVEMLKRVLPEYQTKSVGDNAYEMEKGDECCYMCCGGAFPDSHHKYQVSVGSEGFKVDNGHVNMGVVDNRPIYIVEAFRVRDKIRQAMLQELLKNEDYLAQVEIQKAAIGAASVPAQQTMVKAEVCADAADKGDAPAADIATQLEKLGKMKESGLLTDEEFQQAKKAAIAKFAGVEEV